MAAIDPKAEPVGAAASALVASPGDGDAAATAETAARAALARLTRAWSVLAGTWVLAGGTAGAWVGRAGWPAADAAAALGAAAGASAAAAWLVAGAAPMARRLARGDGSRLAAWTGARPLATGFGPLVADGGLDAAEARFVEAARAAAQATGLPRPRLHVWDGEPSINLMAAGWTPSTSAVIATRGALDKLGERELQALVLHQLLLVRSGQARYQLAATSLVAAFAWLRVEGRRLCRPDPATGDAAGPLRHLAGSLLGAAGSIAAPWTALVQRAAARRDVAGADQVLATAWPSWTPPLASALQKVWYEADLLLDAPVAARLALLRPFLLWSRPQWHGITHPPFAERLRALTGRDLLPLAPMDVGMGPGPGADAATAARAADVAAELVDADLDRVLGADADSGARGGTEPADAPPAPVPSDPGSMPASVPASARWAATLAAADRAADPAEAAGAAALAARVFGGDGPTAEADGPPTGAPAAAGRAPAGADDHRAAVGHAAGTESSPAAGRTDLPAAPPATGPGSLVAGWRDRAAALGQRLGATGPGPASSRPATVAPSTESPPPSSRFATLPVAPPPDSPEGRALAQLVGRALPADPSPAARAPVVDPGSFDERAAAEARRALGLPVTPPSVPPPALPAPPMPAPAADRPEPRLRAGGETGGRRRWRWRRMRAAGPPPPAADGDVSSGWQSGFGLSSGFGPVAGFDDQGDEETPLPALPPIPAPAAPPPPDPSPTPPPQTPLPKVPTPAPPPPSTDTPGRPARVARPPQGRGLAPASGADPASGAPLSRPLPLPATPAEALGDPRAHGDAGDAADRLSRLAGRDELRAAVLGCMLTPDHAHERAAWVAEMGEADGLVRVLADLAAQPRAARMPWFAELVRRAAGGPLEDRRGLVEAARRVMTAAGVVKPLDRLRWLALRHGLGSGARRMLTTATADQSPAFYRANLQSIATYTAFLARIIPVYSADVGIDPVGERWYTAVLQRFIGVSPLPPCRVPDSDSLVHALRALQGLSWINRPPLIRAWVGEAIGHSGPAGLTRDAADALYLTCWMLDSPMPPELARLFPPVAGGPVR